MKSALLTAVIAVGTIAAAASPAAAADVDASAGATVASSVTGVVIDPGHSNSWPLAISTGGNNEVIGGHSVGYDTHGFVYRAGVLTDLGTWPGGDYSLPHGINRNGDIVGESGSYDSPGSIHAVLWRNGVMRDLGTLGGNSFAYAINSNGVIVGNSEVTASGAQFRAVMWRNGTMAELPTLQGSTWDVADLLDDHGDAAGYSMLASGVQHAVLWTGGGIRDLGPGSAVALDSRGQVLVQGADSQGTYAFLWDHGTKTMLPATVTSVVAVNDHGQVVGDYVPTGTTQQHGFLWSAGVMTDLGTLAPVGLNDHGQVLVHSSTAYGLAYVWDHGGLTQLLPASGTVAIPTAINDNGLIAGTTGMNTATIWQLR